MYIIVSAFSLNLKISKSNLYQNNIWPGYKKYLQQEKYQYVTFSTVGPCNISIFWFQPSSASPKM